MPLRHKRNLAARENDPFWRDFFHFCSRDRVRFEFRINAELANPPGDQLVILTAIIKYDDLVVILVCQAFSTLLFKLY